MRTDGAVPIRFVAALGCFAMKADSVSCPFFVLLGRMVMC